jgi:alpha-mannosidase
VTLDGLTLENVHLRVELGEDGTVLSVIEKASGREALAAPGNVLELYEDRPVKFDAWTSTPRTSRRGVRARPRIPGPPSRQGRYAVRSSSSVA